MCIRDRVIIERQGIRSAALTGARIAERAPKPSHRMVSNGIECIVLMPCAPVRAARLIDNARDVKATPCMAGAVEPATRRHSMRAFVAWGHMAHVTSVGCGLCSFSGQTRGRAKN